MKSRIQGFIVITGLSLALSACSTTTTTKRDISHLSASENSTMVIYRETVETKRTELFRTSHKYEIKDSRAAICESTDTALKCDSLAIEIDGQPLTIKETHKDSLF